MEFVVDGERLGQVLGPFLDLDDATDDYVTVLATDWAAGVALKELDRLLGEAVSPQLGGRTAMYVCWVCSDIGCGAVTAVVEVGDDKVVWRDFGYQNDYLPFDQDAIFTGVGPFMFDRDEYWRVLEQFRSIVSETPREPGGREPT